MQKIVVIVGPTGVGKTNLAFDVARIFDGELVSADSIQVYKSLDIISGKDIPSGYTYKEGCYISKNGPSIHLLDIIDPTSSFNVSDYHEKATEAIDLIFNKEKLPIVVGGTGLYIESLLSGLRQTVPADLVLRDRLSALSVDKLQSMLPREVLSLFNDSDRNNKRRLIRRIETNSNPPAAKHNPQPKYDSLVIGLKCEREIIRERIDKRVEDRLKHGAMEEVKKLYENYDRLAQQVKDANGYKQLFSFLKEEIGWEAAVYRWKISEYRHAKNQMTWFRKYGDVVWFDIQENGFAEKVNIKVNKFLKP